MHCNVVESGCDLDTNLNPDHNAMLQIVDRTCGMVCLGIMVMPLGESIIVMMGKIAGMVTP